MRISIIDKAVKNTLDLTSEELVRLLRFRRLDTRRVPFKIVSPVLIVCDDKKFECEILDIKSLNRSPYDEQNVPSDFYGEGEDLDPGMVRQARKQSEKTEDIEPFTLKIELPPGLFAELTKVDQVIVLMRVQNIPVYVRTDAVRVDYNKEGTYQEPGEPERQARVKDKPALLIKVPGVRPILDLLKAQITESAFHEVFIDGKSDEFYDAKDAKLDEIVEIIGIKRRFGESDVELRNRVIAYLKIRMAEATKLKDEELQQMVNETEKQREIDRRIDDASKKQKKNG